MNIAFDAKRAYHNGTGLGHYSRTLINSMAAHFPQHQYFLCNPKPSDYFKPNFTNVTEVNPTGLISKKLSSIWRSSWVKNDLNKLNIDLYHGLSHEIPVGICKTKIKSVVTIHDLIHERYPEQYSKVDAKIYNKKFRYACQYADRIIAISQQTKNDIIDFYKVDPRKIDICYQSCNPSFAQRISTDVKKNVLSRYGLPPQFYLYVGSLIERKNALTVIKAIEALGDDNHIPLVIIGKGAEYANLLKQYVAKQGLETKVIFMADNKQAQRSESFRNAADFPAIYQSATAMIYPSTFEGFGIPVLEALWSRLPVITSNVSCLPEAAGAGSILIDPFDVAAMANAMHKVATNQALCMQMIDDGWQHAHQFTNERCATEVMKVYHQLIS